VCSMKGRGGGGRGGGVTPPDSAKRESVFKPPWAFQHSLVVCMCSWPGIHFVEHVVFHALRMGLRAPGVRWGFCRVEGILVDWIICSGGWTDAVFNPFLDHAIQVFVFHDRFGDGKRGRGGPL
jgi:hypothetical protein